MPDAKPGKQPDKQIPIQLTTHFKLLEFACKCGCKGHEAPAVLANLTSLAMALEVLRVACGKKAIHLNCGYRCPAHNASPGVGGNDQSQHLTGRAADIRVEGMEPEAVQSIALLVAPIGGVGSYKTFTHVDVRPRIKGRQARWHG